MGNLVQRLSLPEAVGMSVSIICPTVTAAFNVTLVVQAAGAAAPLAFAIGTVAMVLVALSFIAFTHRVAHAGSAYAYISHTFGSRAGFVAGWTLLLTYLGFATAQAALVGSFTAAALRGFSIDIGAGWLTVGGTSIAVAWWLAFRDMRLAGRLMLGMEAAAMAGILVLCVSILLQTHPSAAETAASFRPSAAYGGWPALGFGMVFCVLSFGGFEGAATLGEETRNPRRNIPIALLFTVLVSGAFFTFVAYCEVIGFGPGGLKALGKAEAPLNDLALRYASPRLAIALDLAAAASCFSGLLGPLAAAGRVLFALGRGGLAPAMGAVHPVHGTPALVFDGADPPAVPDVGAIHGRRELLRLRQHHRGPRADLRLHQRRRGRNGRVVARTQADLVRRMHDGTAAPAVGLVPLHLSGAGLPQ